MRLDAPSFLIRWCVKTHPARPSRGAEEGGQSHFASKTRKIGTVPCRKNRDSPLSQKSGQSPGLAKIARLPAQLARAGGKILQPCHQHVDDFALFLQAALGDQNRGPGGRLEKAPPDVGADDQVGHAGFVFQRDEGDAVGRGRALADQHQSGHPHGHSVVERRQARGRHDASAARARRAES